MVTSWNKAHSPGYGVSAGYRRNKNMQMPVYKNPPPTIIIQIIESTVPNVPAKKFEVAKRIIIRAMPMASTNPDVIRCTFILSLKGSYLRASRYSGFWKIRSSNRFGWSSSSTFIFRCLLRS